MHSRTHVGRRDAGEITRVSKMEVLTDNFSDNVPLQIEGFSPIWTGKSHKSVPYSKKATKRNLQIIGPFL